MSVSGSVHDTTVTSAKIDTLHICLSFPPSSAFSSTVTPPILHFTLTMSMTDINAEPVASLDDPEPERVLTLESKQGDHFRVAQVVAIQSKLVQTTVEGDKESTHVPLHQVSTATLARVVEYMNHHHNNPAAAIPKPLRSAAIEEAVSEWDAKFIKLTVDELFELVLAANYLDCPPLLELACAKIASMIKGKTPVQIKKTFGAAQLPTATERQAADDQQQWESQK